MTGEKISYSDYRKHVIRLANALFKRGVKRNDIMCVIMPNCVEYGIILFSMPVIGGILTFTNPTYTPGKHTFLENNTFRVHNNILINKIHTYFVIVVFSLPSHLVVLNIYVYLFLGEIVKQLSDSKPRLLMIHSILYPLVKEILKSYQGFDVCIED